MKVCVLGSGSSGNSIFIEDKDTRILIDAGFSRKKIQDMLESINVSPRSINGLLLTHEHTDHIQGAGLFSSKFRVPIYITSKSFNAGKKKLEKADESLINYITGDFSIGNIKDISPFEVMHDAAQTIGFSIKSHDDKKISIATDIGYITNKVRDRFQKSDFVVIESNYDYSMLMNGKYPWILKNRVKSKNGHLSNEDSAKFIHDIYHQNLNTVILAHISRENNEYDLALKNVESYLKRCNIDANIHVALQSSMSKIFDF